MRVVEERAFSDGITAESLMEEAGEKIAAAVRQFEPEPGRCLVFFGKGHNGGDALVAARHLAAAGWNIELRPTFPWEDWSPLTACQHERLLAAIPPAGMRGTRARHEPLVILDGFYHFTRAQRVLIETLAEGGARMLAALTLPEAHEKRAHVFELTENTLAFLQETGFKPSKAVLDKDRKSVV